MTRYDIEKVRRKVIEALIADYPHMVNPKNLSTRFMGDTDITRMIALLETLKKEGIARRWVFEDTGVWYAATKEAMENRWIRTTKGLK